MGEQTVLVVGDENDADELGRALDGQGAVTLRSAETLEELFDALCYDTVSTLVVPGPVEGATPRAVVRGVRGLYPELPVVVVEGDTAEDIEDGARDAADTEGGDARPVTVVEADALTDERVVDTVRGALATDDVGAAGRPPSRLETLAMSMFDEFPDQLYAKDASARHLLTSDAGLQTSDLIGRTDAAIDGASEEHTDRTVDDDRYVIEKGNPLLEREEYTGADGDADIRYTRTSKMPWYGPDGSVVGLVGVTRDISDWKSQERTLRQQNERLAKIAIVAAHELRNELQVASGRFDLATGDPEQAEVVADSLAQLETITDDVVRLANAETHEADERSVWLSTSAREVWEALPTSDARLTVDVDRLVVADPRALRLLFEILLSNAIQHGGSDVTVMVGATDDGFYVADDGTGIDLDPPERVFDVGFELGDTDVGIGLYVARRIAVDHGWSLDVSNRPDGGARFDVAGVTDPRADDS
jgi:signal transduction histidine kinase